MSFLYNYWSLSLIIVDMILFLFYSLLIVSSGEMEPQAQTLHGLYDIGHTSKRCQSVKETGGKKLLFLFANERFLLAVNPPSQSYGDDNALQAGVCQIDSTSVCTSAKTSPATA